MEDTTPMATAFVQRAGKQTLMGRKTNNISNNTNTNTTTNQRHQQTKSTHLVENKSGSSSEMEITADRLSSSSTFTSPWQFVNPPLAPPSPPPPVLSLPPPPLLLPSALPLPPLLSPPSSPVAEEEATPKLCSNTWIYEDEGWRRMDARTHGTFYK